jgi:hypothetical protein
MRIFTVDQQDKVGDSIKHLEQELAQTAIGRFHKKDAELLTKIASFDLPAASGYEIVAVVSVDFATKSGAWTFADNAHDQMEAGMAYVSENNINIWLRSVADGEAARKLLFTYLKQAYDWTYMTADTLRQNLGKDIGNLLLQNIFSRNEDIAGVTATLDKLREEQLLALYQYARLKEF